MSSFISLAFASLFFLQDDGDWTRFRGAGGHGVARAQSDLEIDLEKPRFREKLVGPGHSSPVLAEDSIFLTAMIPGDAEGEKARRAILCHDRADGRLLWKEERSFQTHKQHRLNSFASSTPVLDEDQVYVAWSNGETMEIEALDHEGNSLWTKDLGSFRAGHGSGSSPILVGEVLIMAKDNESDESFLIGLDCESGDVVWKVDRTSGRAPYMTPVVIEREGRSEVL